MNEAEQICGEIQKTLPKIKRGTLRFWGVWFGRPYDNYHTMVAAEHSNGALRLRFDGDEQLTLWSPVGLESDSSVFRINHAERVLWEWFYYGRLKTNENRFFYDFVKTPETIVGRSNVYWYTPEMKTDQSLPATEILSIEIRVKRE